MTTPPRTRNRPAFTLLELMISIALALLLILGINEVFSLTSRTVGATQSVIGSYQGSRAAQAVISSDFRGAIPMSSAPCMIIASEMRFAFRNRADFNADTDQDPSTLDPGNQPVPPNALHPRSHRTDRIGFFANGNFPTQTGSVDPATRLGPFIDTTTQAGGPRAQIPVSSNEAWIVYGHLNVPDNSGTPAATSFPGAGTVANNPNNFFAGQWVLGRNVFLLAPSPGKLFTTPPKPPVQYAKADAGLGPLAYLSATNDPTYPNTWHSRHDIAETSVDQFLAQLTGYATSGRKPYYWDALVSDPLTRFVGNPLPFKGTNGASGITPDSAAQVAPCFLTGCTQFAVEFTGDFVTQDNDPTHVPPNNRKSATNPNGTTYGDVLGPGPDGVPDYQVVFDSGAVFRQQVRWYGMPRSTSGDRNGKIDKNFDVVPVSVVAGSQLFEREVPHYADQTPYGSVQAGDRYVVAWGPDTQSPPAPATGPAPSPSPTPTMLRFTITLDDMSNRTGAGQTFEFVVPLQQ